MILRIFLCTLGWSVELAKNWDTEKSYLKSLSVEYHFNPLLRDTRLTRLTSFNAPRISEMKRSTFHCSTSCIFFKKGDTKTNTTLYIAFKSETMWVRKTEYDTNSLFPIITKSHITLGLPVEM